MLRDEEVLQFTDSQVISKLPLAKPTHMDSFTYEIVSDVPVNKDDGSGGTGSGSGCVIV